jgi:hypothetical protein
MTRYRGRRASPFLRAACEEKETSMKTVSLAAVLPLIALSSVCSAIPLAPGQTAVADLMPDHPNEVPFFLGPDGQPAVGALPLFPIQGGYSPYIFRNTTNNHLTFTWDLSYGDPLRLQTITFTGYQGYTVDAGYQNALPLNLTIVPSTITRSLDGDSLTFFFGGGAPVAGKINLLIRTNATDYSGGSVALQFVNQDPLAGLDPLKAFSPAPFSTTAPVPELSSFSLLTLATASLVLRTRRRA